MLAENLAKAELLAAENAENRLAHEQARRPSIQRKMAMRHASSAGLYSAFSAAEKSSLGCDAGATRGSTIRLNALR